MCMRVIYAGGFAPMYMDLHNKPSFQNSLKLNLPTYRRQYHPTFNGFSLIGGIIVTIVERYDGAKNIHQLQSQYIGHFTTVYRISQA